MVRAALEYIGRESGENFKPMECVFGKNGFGGS